MGSHRIQGTGSDTTRRLVYCALVRRIAISIRNQAHIGQSVLDLSTFKKTQPAIYPIGGPALDQRLLKQTGLGTGTVEDGNLSASAPLFNGISNPPYHETGLIHLIKGSIGPDRVSLATFGPEVLSQAR